MRNRLIVVTLLFAALPLASCVTSRGSSTDDSPWSVGARADTCSPGWSLNAPIDPNGIFVYEPQPGTGRSLGATLDDATDRISLAFLRRMYQAAANNRTYRERSGQDTSWTPASDQVWVNNMARRSFIDHGHVSGSFSVARSAFCRVAGTYQVWVLERMSLELLQRRLWATDSLARGIDFRKELQQTSRP